MKRAMDGFRIMIRLATCAGLIALAACSGHGEDQKAKKPGQPQSQSQSRPESQSQTSPAVSAAAVPAASTSSIPSEPGSLTAEQAARNNRGVGLMGKFEYEPARQEFQSLLKERPDSLDVQVNLAIATLNRQKEGDEDAALAMLDKVLAADPKHLRAHYCEGLLKLYIESAEEALVHFQLVAAADPQDAYAAYYTGQCLAAMKRYEDAAKWYDKAIAVDPYLRSAYNAASLAHRALHDDARSAELQDTFQKMAKNPRAHLAKFAYSLMGSKGNAQVLDAPAPGKAAAAKPEGPLFLDPVALLDDGDRHAWKKQDGKADRPTSITACDIDGDGAIDIFIADVLADADGARNAVCMNTGDGHFRLDADHPLAKIENVNAALWGDYDNDGLTDAYLCRRGPNMLWRQAARNQWTDVTQAAGVADGSFDTVDGAIFDADHDGDLDIFCVNADGPNELFNNDMDGTFKPIARERGIAGGGKGSRQALPVDLDGDRDLDLVVINNEPPHDVWMNDRLWNYHPAAGFDEFRDADIAGVVAADRNADGQTELITFLSRHQLIEWAVDGMGRWRPSAPLAERKPAPGAARPLAVVDLDGDGRLRTISPEKGGWIVEGGGYWATTEGVLSNWAVVVLNPSEGVSVVSMGRNARPVIWRPGSGRHPFASLSFSGRQVLRDNAPIRSNASGIGTHYAARVDSRWVVGDVMKDSSGPGQSLQPVSIGLGDQKRVDFVSIDWSDGVFQSEIDLEGGKLHAIEETQRQLSSCPVIFAWNGEEHRFVTDCLGVGGIGYAVGPGEYAPARPWERVLLPEDAIEPRDGRYVIKLGEPMEEACYLDAARLAEYDLPPGWKATLDERMGVLGPEPTGEARFYRDDDEMTPKRVTNDRGEDVTESVLKADLAAAPVGEVDPRFIGMLVKDHVLTMEFDRPIDAGGSGSWPTLIIDGWIEYPYSQTSFAAWQAKAACKAPTIEARSEDGQWRMALEQFGYPAGMPRQMSVPLPLDKLPRGTRELRITTNQEIYFDRISIACARECPQAARRELPLREAKLIASGFARRTTGPQRQPFYDYGRRTPLWDTRHQPGLYTAFGACTELLAAKDDALAIFGPGEEIHMEFDAGERRPPLPEGWTRRHVLEVEGWCKDMDLYTKDGETLGPLPGEDNPARRRLHEKYNTRFEAGR